MSHFTTVQTEIKDITVLKKVLKALGFEFTEAKANEKVLVRGYARQRAQADMAIHISKSYDIGVVITEKGVKFVADWWGVETTRGITEQEFLKLVVKRYALEKVKQEVLKKGYTIALEEEKQDQTIHIRLRKYA
jgi:hypothetical protein